MLTAILSIEVSDGINLRLQSRSLDPTLTDGVCTPVWPKKNSSFCPRLAAEELQARSTNSGGNPPPE
jgi:hypothetical protein